MKYAYEKSYFSDKSIFRISTARAGNVIGGGDLNENRIIPDCYRAIKSKSDMLIRNPLSIRPYQYV
ncbi:MAG: CDP-glucose 4,6-dehydratase, partial [Lachnospiraceae bacterium]|nr:CDP-glucose 4,6-dehydratase [Lachnospiraceae bacterium]